MVLAAGKGDAVGAEAAARAGWAGTETAAAGTGWLGALATTATWNSPGVDCGPITAAITVPDKAPRIKAAAT
jgi:hypothetical protein